MFSIIFTVVNACLTLISVLCAVYSSRQTKFQTEIMQKQLEHDLEPDFALTTHLDGIQHSIYSVRDSINQANKDNKA